MYDWSNEERKMNKQIENRFSCCWKDVRLKRPQRHTAPAKEMFQLLLKGCTIEATSDGLLQVSVSFQLLLKGCTIEADRRFVSGKRRGVSVVVERMYDWSSETNWLKTNDFWQLVSDLFFENGRSAQKVPLFSKIWGDLGDCLTVFDSYSNI